MPKSKRGFASMSQEQRRAIASLGGKAAHAMGRAHTYTREEAIIAGRKGGLKRNYPGIPDLKAERHLVPLLHFLIHKTA